MTDSIRRGDIASLSTPRVMNWDAFNTAVATAHYPWLGGDRERIEEATGLEGASLVDEMVAFGNGQRDLWDSSATWVEVQPDLTRRLRAKYPSLSIPAAERIALAVAYSWR